MARQWERVDEDTAVGPRFGQDPPPSFSAPTLALAGDLIVAEEPAGRDGFLRQLKGESRTAAEVVMDDALVQDDGIDLIVEELRSRKTKTKRRRSKRPSSRHRGTSKWKRPS